MKVKEAIKITEGFTRTSKMPGLSYSLPAWECKKFTLATCAGCRIKAQATSNKPQAASVKQQA